MRDVWRKSVSSYLYGTRCGLFEGSLFGLKKRRKGLDLVYSDLASSILALLDNRSVVLETWGLTMQIPGLLQ